MKREDITDQIEICEKIIEGNDDCNIVNMKMNELTVWEAVLNRYDTSDDFDEESDLDSAYDNTREMIIEAEFGEKPNPLAREKVMLT